MTFRDRVDAGRQLAARLNGYANRHDVVVLALPRGGVPVGYEVAAALRAPLDVFLVRKLGVPGHPELAMGAIASGGVRVLSESLIDELGIPRNAVEQVAVRERLELERRDRLYRGERPMPSLRDRTVILVDDGLATGATMEAAIEAVKVYEPAKVVVAAPVGAPETCDRLRPLVSDLVCVETPWSFQAVGLWYQRFDQTSDDEVIELLRRNAAERSATHNPGVHLSSGSGQTLDIVRNRAQRLDGGSREYDRLIESIGDARLVLIGEATHGTHEFYRDRAFITQRLITDKGFSAVAVEADWPDAHRVNRYVRSLSDDRDANEALGAFGRFPTWMWRNTDVIEFVSWLRAHNDTQRDERKVGFYGLDLYSLRASIEAVLAYLAKADPEAARRAKTRYACFDQFGEEPQHYGYSAKLGLTPTCEREVVAQLVELQRQRASLLAGGAAAHAEFFSAEQNARLVRNAEAYYRAMFASRDESWNLRDRHMADALGELLQFLANSGRASRVVVWAHNSHLGDARATEMGERGELNVGQLVRERFDMDAALVGMTTHDGTVTAAPEWDDPPERRNVRPSLPDSFERLFHDAGLGRFFLPMRDDLALAGALSIPRLERAIGVIYAPATERMSHYFHARLASQFDYVIHMDRTTALEPLERTAGWEVGEPAETFPSGM